MNNPGITAIFEAGFRHADVEVYVDVLERGENGWNLIEVKSSTSVKDEHLDDLAIQVWVAQRAGLAIERIELMHVDAEFIYPGDGHYDGLFVRQDLTEDVRRHLPYIEDTIHTLRAVTRDPEPKIHIGRQCKIPYLCEYFDHCSAEEPPFPVMYLPRGGNLIDRLISEGIYDLREIPIDALQSETQQWVRHVTIQSRPELLPGAARILNELDYPRYFLDFECVQFAIPIWAGTHPYEQHPFQWSCHIQHTDGSLEHREFLDTAGRDPRRAFAECLVAACGEHGPVMVYNASFEKKILKALELQCPDLTASLAAIRARVFDLLPIVRTHYYHPDMKGSWSIKSVLPCLAPELDYRRLGQVQDGTQAQEAYLRLIDDGIAPDEQIRLREDLRRYCEMDTLAMVRIAEHLSGRSRTDRSNTW
jgi:hypothetical protein